MSSRWLSLGLFALAVVAGAEWWLQRQVAAQLRGEIALLRDEQRALVRLRVENQRLTAAQPPATELKTLRADHDAVGRLRDEMERTKENVQARERALAGGH